MRFLIGDVLGEAEKPHAKAVLDIHERWIANLNEEDLKEIFLEHDNVHISYLETSRILHITWKDNPPDFWEDDYE